jgi:hypothetical protein
VSPGQTFTITTTSGQTYNLLYADVAPQTYQGVDEGSRVDIYDPNNALGGGNNFEESVASVNGGPVVQGQGGPGLASMLPNSGGGPGDQVLWAFTLGLTWIAMGLQWLMSIAQQLLYLIEIAISPIFIACLMVPALSYLARKFFLILIGICLWPLAWSICNLVTIFLIALTVNSSNSTTLTITNAIAALTGPLTGVAYFLVLAAWVIGSTLAAPIFIAILLGSSGGPTAAVSGTTIGAAAAGAGRAAWGGIGGGAGVVNAISWAGDRMSNGNGSAPVSVQSASRISGPTQNFARRPVPQTEEKT